MMPIQISKISLSLQFYNTFVWSSKSAELSRRHFKHALTHSLDATSRQSPSLNYEWSCYQLPSSLLFDAMALMKKDPGKPTKHQCYLDVAAVGGLCWRGGGFTSRQLKLTLQPLLLYLKTEMKAQGPHLFQCNDCAIWRKERFVWSSWYLSPWPFSIPSLAIWQMCQLDYFKRALNK